MTLIDLTHRPTVTLTADWSPAESHVPLAPPPLLSTPHLSPTIQLSDMCFIAMAVLLTILPSLSHNHILMNNIFASLFHSPSAFSLFSCYPSSSISSPLITSGFFFCVCVISDTACRSVSTALLVPDSLRRKLV